MRMPSIFGRLRGSNSNVYQYRQLKTANAIRLLSVLPGSFQDEITVRIEEIELNPRKPPNYEALSYTWGVAKRTVVIRTGEDRCEHTLITENLATALRHLRQQNV